MKAAINRITDEAKRRDTIGRNKITTLRVPGNLGTRLDGIQRAFSSDNVEKMTHLIIIDADLNRRWLLKYRIMQVEGQEPVGDDVEIEMIWESLVRKYPDLKRRLELYRDQNGDDNPEIADERGEVNDSE